MTAGIPELSVRCPHCQAPPGQRCTDQRGRRALRHIAYHPARHDAYTQQATTARSSHR